LARIVEILLGLPHRSLLCQLRYPASSRPTRLSNIQAILDQLNTSSELKGLVQAKDIVDGAREKTLGLLWLLVTRYGLTRLIDSDDLSRETTRLSKQIDSPGQNQTVYHYIAPSDDDLTEKLRLWAGAIARLHKLEMSNLTTSFADGKIFAAIVTEYENFFPKHHETANDSSFTEKLKAIGCSDYFGKSLLYLTSSFALSAFQIYANVLPHFTANLFSTNKHGVTGHIFDEQFTVSGLAFLASRLLNWSGTARAASIIQKAYRSHTIKRVIRHRVRACILAHHAAEYVVTRQRIEKATVIIQRAFRSSLQRRMDRFFKAMIGLQAIIRGALVRKELFGWNVVDDEEEEEEEEGQITRDEIRSAEEEVIGNKEEAGQMRHDVDEDVQDDSDFDVTFTESGDVYDEEEDDGEDEVDEDEDGERTDMTVESTMMSDIWFAYANQT